MCDGLVYWKTCPEIWPKSFKKQRSYNISKHLVKKRRLFEFLAPWTPNLRIFLFSKTDLVVHVERNRMALITPSKSALRFSRSQGGRIGPPHQLTSSRKPTSNRTRPRAPLGLVRPLPSAGGGGGRSGPHLSRKPTDVAEKFKHQWRGLDESFQIKLKNLTSGSHVTSQVRSNIKCLTFPFNAFPPQNDGNKRISSLWIDMIRACDISNHRP